MKRKDGEIIVQKQDALQNFNNRYLKEYYGKEVVLGDGNVNANVLLIGEAPGKDEVKLAKPFVGAAGKNLDEFLAIVGIDRNSIYITNAIKYRLSRVNLDTGRIVNRPATVDEIKSNRMFLAEEVNIIAPRFIVTLGNVPLKSIINDYGIGIGTVHGELKNITLFEKDYSLFPLYHPASIIYNRKLKDVYIKDLEKLKDIIG